MSIEDIFATIMQHQIKGLMIHSQMADYYSFLGLYGYSKCHEYHYYSENVSFRKVNQFYIESYGKLIPELPVENPNIVPSSWFKYNAQEIDNATRKSAVRTGLDSWLEWEESTKSLLEDMYHELEELGDTSALHIVDELLCDVCHELKKVRRYRMQKRLVEYDMGAIAKEQELMHSKYEDKLHKCLC